MIRILIATDSCFFLKLLKLKLLSSSLDFRNVTCMLYVSKCKTYSLSPWHVVTNVFLQLMQIFLSSFIISCLPFFLPFLFEISNRRVLVFLDVSHIY